MACLGWLQNLALGGSASTAVAATVAGLPLKRHWILPNGMKFYGLRSEVEAFLRRMQPEPTEKTPAKVGKPRITPRVMAVTVDEPIETVSIEPFIRPVEQVITDREMQRRRRKALELLLAAA